MRKFRNKESGAIMLVTNDFTLKQMIKSDRYEEVVEKETKKVEKETKKVEKETKKLKK